MPTGLSKREGSDEGCTSLEHPQPRTHAIADAPSGPAAAAAAFLAQQPAAAAAAAAANDFSALTGAQVCSSSGPLYLPASFFQDIVPICREGSSVCLFLWKSPSNFARFCGGARKYVAPAGVFIARERVSAGV